MATYQPTRGDKKKFLRDLKPGKTYYSVEECVQPWGNEMVYRTWVFKPSRLWGAVCGHLSAEGVLANYGPITDVKPAGLRGLFDEPPQVAGPLPVGKEFGRDLVADAYAEEIAAAKKAAEEAKKSREKETVGAGKKSRGWW